MVIYGPEGIGKSTFAACFPKPLFIDTEGSTKNLNVSRTPRPGSFAMVMDQIRYVKENANICKTLTIDTADWAEQLVLADICARHQKKGIEDFGYGKGYVYLAEDFGRMLNLLEDLIELDINVVITAHAAMRKFEQPDESGAYDRWELKLKKQTAPLLKEWADMLLFANYKTLVFKDENDKAKARGGKRVMYTTHHPCWDAKNRHGLDDELPFEYQQIDFCIAKESKDIEKIKKAEKASDKPNERLSEAEQAETTKPTAEKSVKPAETATQIPEGPLKNLYELMKVNNVSESDIQLAVSQKGYFPQNTPITKYGDDFIGGCLVGAWDKVFEMIKKNWDNTPF